MEMWFFIIFIFIIPASSSPACPDPVTAPGDLLVTPGSCLSVPCRYHLCRSLPLLNLTWLHRPFYDPSRREFLGRLVSRLPGGSPGVPQGSCDLRLPRVQPPQAGLYGLRLVAGKRPNRELRWIHYLNVSLVATPPPPHFWPDPSPLSQDSITTFGCWVPLTCPEEPPNLTWTGPATWGAQITPWTPPNPLTPFPALGTHLTFKTFWYHDGSNLTCHLRGVDGKTLAQVTRQLQVHYAPREVRVEVAAPSPIREGQEVTLRCLHLARPPPYSFTWTLGGRVLPYREPQILIGRVQAGDGGNYSCEATNGQGTGLSPPASLEVQYAPRDLWVEATPPPPVLEGQEVTLRCRHSAHPSPHVFTWTLEGRSLGRKEAQVLLGPAQATHGGTYRCGATNPLGTATSPPLRLEVYYPPRAAILENLTALPVLAGSPLTLHCSLGPAHPSPLAVQWLRDDRRVADTPGPALTFLAGPAHAGSYRCGGSNMAGSAFSSPLRVVVWYPPKSARILQVPGGPVVSGGSPTWLRCQVGDSQPPQVEVTWLKEGRKLPLPPGDLFLPLPQPSDAATYVCEARNQGGVTRSPPHHLDVLYGPQGAELVASPGQWVEEGDDVTLRCHARAHPPPHTYEWFWEGGSLGRSRQGLWVIPAARGTPASGRYRCRVINDVTAADSPDVIITVYYSRATIARRSLVGLAVGLSLLLLLGTFGFLLRRRWRQQRASDEEPVVAPTGNFFLRKKKGVLSRTPGSPRCPAGPDDTVPRGRGDTVIYTVLKRNQGVTKAPEGPDYENVAAGGAAGAPGAGEQEGTLVYVTLALASPGDPPGP